jgi:hypothetical protein
MLTLFGTANQNGKTGRAADSEINTYKQRTPLGRERISKEQTISLTFASR